MLFSKEVRSMVQIQTSIHIGFLEEGISTVVTVDSLVGQHCVFILFLLCKGFEEGLEMNTCKPTRAYGRTYPCTHTQASMQTHTSTHHHRYAYKSKRGECDGEESSVLC